MVSGTDCESLNLPVSLNKGVYFKSHEPFLNLTLVHGIRISIQLFILIYLIASTGFASLLVWPLKSLSTVRQFSHTKCIFPINGMSILSFAYQHNSNNKCPGRKHERIRTTNKTHMDSVTEHACNTEKRLNFLSSDEGVPLPRRAQQWVGAET